MHHDSFLPQASYRARSALDGLSVFVDTVLMMHSARTLSLANDQGGGGTKQEPSDDSNGTAGAGGDAMAVDPAPPPAAAAVPSASVASPLPPVIDDLVPRVLHCCCEDTWQVGGKREG